VQNDAEASPSVTSFLPPAGVTVDAVRGGLKKQFGIVIADGQKDLKGKIMRIGHLGHISEREIYTTLSALESVMTGLGVKIEPGSGVAAAMQEANRINSTAKQEPAATHV
jgi:aspartate aminotransferase-like enzyme